ncbi:hypothetical protein B0T20DRAFT_415831 [Sordaria brevicollis]|uniref:Uncharacterized protein n=1 Tax=Sordaria brevicollis TaxID=83679 RepID=A0AAE0UB60_SORBR|nr:hypothetical protein B0T20DRAFT_415831 [Sordaria brevicollis]
MYNLLDVIPITIITLLYCNAVGVLLGVDCPCNSVFVIGPIFASRKTKTSPKVDKHSLKPRLSINTDAQLPRSNQHFNRFFFRPGPCRSGYRSSQGGTEGILNQGRERSRKILHLLHPTETSTASTVKALLGCRWAQLSLQMKKKAWNW